MKAWGIRAQTAGFSTLSDSFRRLGSRAVDRFSGSERVRQSSGRSDERQSALERRVDCGHIRQPPQNRIDLGFEHRRNIVGHDD